MNEEWLQVLQERDDLLAEIEELTALLEETNHHLDLMVGCFGIGALVELVECAEG